MDFDIWMETGMKRFSSQPFIMQTIYKLFDTLSPCSASCSVTFTLCTVWVALTAYVTTCFWINHPVVQICDLIIGLLSVLLARKKGLHILICIHTQACTRFGLYSLSLLTLHVLTGTHLLTLSVGWWMALHIESSRLDFLAAEKDQHRYFG